MQATSAKPTAETAGPAPAFRLTCWGDFAITAAATGVDLHPRGRKARALLAYLALHPAKSISRERLTGLLWGDRGEEQARASLRQAIIELRAFTAAEPPLVTVGREALRLDPAQLDSDFAAFARAAANADLAALAAELPEPHEFLFANLDDIDADFDAWLAIERTRQREVLARLVTSAAEAAVASGRDAEARTMLLRFDPAGPLPPPATAVGRAVPPPAATKAQADPAADPGADSAAAPIARRRLPILAATATALATLAGYAVMRPAPAPATAEAPVAIAVLPFASLSAGNQAYFAQGVSEEILAQLARNQRLKVLGRTSAGSLHDEKLDATAIGKKLGVNYLVEGSVRTMGADVRIDVALVRTSDGARLWSQQYPGRLDDIFAIQDRIGKGVAEQLRRSSGIVPAIVDSGAGEAYRLYFEARGMVREREPSRTPAAVALLRRAVALDPDFAPAHAALGSVLLVALEAAQRAGSATKADERKVFAEVGVLANRALALKRDLGEAHRLLGVIATTSDGRRHFETAVRLDPNDAASWIHLGLNHNNAGDYPRALDAYRRAVAVDPLWWPAFYLTAELAWDMGYPEEAEAYVRRVEVGGAPLPFKAHMVRNDMAWRRGDFSGGFAEARKASAVSPPNERFTPELGMSRALRAAGRYADARRLWHFYPMDDLMWRMWNGAPPTPAEVNAIVADPACCDMGERLQFIMRRLLLAGRAAEVVRIYDRVFGSPAALLSKDTPGPLSKLTVVPLFALALRREGRGAEAKALLDGVEAQSLAILARGRAPRWFVARHAHVLAAMGHPDAALTALETAVARGWYYASATSLADIADEPAFASLRDTPRFQALRAKLNANVVRERREIDALIAAGPATPPI